MDQGSMLVDGPLKSVVISHKVESGSNPTPLEVLIKALFPERETMGTFAFLITTTLPT